MDRLLEGFRWYERNRYLHVEHLQWIRDEYLVKLLKELESFLVDLHDKGYIRILAHGKLKE